MQRCICLCSSSYISLNIWCFLHDLAFACVSQDVAKNFCEYLILFESALWWWCAATRVPPALFKEIQKSASRRPGRNGEYVLLEIFARILFFYCCLLIESYSPYRPHSALNPNFIYSTLLSVCFKARQTGGRKGAEVFFGKLTQHGVAASNPTSYNTHAQKKQKIYQNEKRKKQQNWTQSKNMKSFTRKP